MLRREASTQRGVQLTAPPVTTLSSLFMIPTTIYGCVLLVIYQRASSDFRVHLKSHGEDVHSHRNVSKFGFLTFSSTCNLIGDVFIVLRDRKRSRKCYYNIGIYVFIIKLKLRNCVYFIFDGRPRYIRS